MTAHSKDDRSVGEKIAGMLGFAARARRLVVGTELVCDMMQRGKKGSCMIVVSEEASDNTKKRIRNCCERTGTEMYTVPIDQSRLGHSIGKKSLVAAVAVTDGNMAKAIRNILKEGA